MKTLKNISLTLIIFLGGIFTACNDDKGDSLDLTADVDILSFKVNNVEGIINNDNGTITVLVPLGLTCRLWLLSSHYPRTQQYHRLP